VPRSQQWAKLRIEKNSKELDRPVENEPFYLFLFNSEAIKLSADKGWGTQEKISLVVEAEANNETDGHPISLYYFIYLHKTSGGWVVRREKHSNCREQKEKEVGSKQKNKKIINEKGKF
jgi:hypothetical protein